MRVQKAENVNKALEFIRQRGIKLTNIGPEGAVVFNKMWHTLFLSKIGHRYHRR